MSVQENQEQSFYDRIPENFYLERPNLGQELKSKLLSDYMVAIIGDSGSGKSSLVEQSLLPTIDDKELIGQAGNEWRVVSLSPAADPIGRLSEALSQPDKLKEKGSVPANFRQKITTKLAGTNTAANSSNPAGPAGLVNLYQEVAAIGEEPFNLLIVVDQLDQLLRFDPFIEPGEDLLFINLLTTAARSKLPIYLILILDTNSIIGLSRYRGLPEIINNYRLFVPNISILLLKQYFQSKAIREAEKDLVNNYILTDFNKANQTETGQNKNAYAVYSLKQKLNGARRNWEKSKTENKLNELSGKELEKILRPLIRTEEEEIQVNHFIQDPNKALEGIDEDFRKKLKGIFVKVDESVLGKKIAGVIDDIEHLLPNANPILKFKHKLRSIRQAAPLSKGGVENNEFWEILSAYFWPFDASLYTDKDSLQDIVEILLKQIEVNKGSFQGTAAILKQAEVDKDLRQGIAAILKQVEVDKGLRQDIADILKRIEADKDSLQGITDILKQIEADKGSLQDITDILKQIEVDKNLSRLEELEKLLKKALVTWGRSKADRQLLITYKKLPPIEGIVSTMLDTKFRTLSKEHQPLVVNMLKAMTELGAKDQLFRIPRKITVLLAFCQRKPENQKLTERQLKEVIRLADEEIPHLFELTEATAGEVVDISSEAVLQNWTTLLSWAQEESLDSNTFIATVKDGRRYVESGKKTLPEPAKKEENDISSKIRKLFSKKASQKQVKTDESQEEEKTSLIDDEPHLYEGQQLYGALKWLTQRPPNEAWANRYLPEFLITDEDKEEMSKFIPQNASKDIKTNLDFAKWFIKYSEHSFFDTKDNEIKVANQRERRANRLKNYALMAGSIAGILMILAGLAWRSSRIAKRNIELIDFVEILNHNNVIYYPSERKDESFRQMEGLTRRVAADKKITNNDSVLTFLNREGYIHFPENNKKLAFSALHSLDALYGALKEKTTSKAKRKKSVNLQASILKITADLLPLQKDVGYQQYPYVYYALMAHQEVHMKEAFRQSKLTEQKQSLIEHMASNPDIDDQFAYGDKNGKVFLKGRNEKNDPPFYLDSIGVAGANVTALHYDIYKQGTVLYAGGERRVLVRFDDVQLRGTDQRKVSTHTLSVANGISYIANTIEEDRLLIVSGKRLYLYQATPSGDTVSYTKLNTRIDSLTLNGVMRARTMSDDNRYLWAGSKNETIVMEVNPSASSSDGFFRQVLQITHEGATISEIGVKHDENGNFWLALGGELGDIWISQQDFLSEGVTSIDINNTAFTHFKFHESTITGLVFNPSYPQMASSALDGYIRFWNLAQLGKDLQNPNLTKEVSFLEESVLNDQIKVKFDGQGIWKITYVNENELAGAENIKTRIWKTNIEALYEELEIIKSTPK